LHLAAAACAQVSNPLRDDARYEGKPIASIAFDPADQPVAASELAAILPLKTGTLLRMEDVRAAIERLYATGRYQYIEVRAEAAGAGVNLVIATKNSWFIGEVSVSGAVGEPPSSGQMVDATELDLGQPFNPADVRAAGDKIRRLLVDNGYYEAAVTSSIDYSETAQQVDVNFQVAAGRRSRFTQPKLSGDVKLSEEKIIKATK
jgi:outer membrane protein assembly factor BamA